jgi:hypothetical protein
MKKLVILFWAIGGLILGNSLVLAQHEGHAHGDAHEKTPVAHEKVQIETKMIQGEVVDITCYLRHDSKGAKHVKCAEYCANLGMPLGLLEDETNQLYLIIPAGHEDPKPLVFPHLGDKVKVHGKLYAMGGLTGVEIEKIEETR